MSCSTRAKTLASTFSRSQASLATAAAAAYLYLFILKGLRTTNPFFTTSPKQRDSAKKNLVLWASKEGAGRQTPRQIRHGRAESRPGQAVDSWVLDAAAVATDRPTRLLCAGATAAASRAATTGTAAAA